MGERERERGREENRDMRTPLSKIRKHNHNYYKFVIVKSFLNFQPKSWEEKLQNKIIFKTLIL